MKKVLFIVNLVLITLYVNAQTSDDITEISKLDSIANAELDAGNYTQSLQFRLKQLEILKQTVGENDSTYIFKLSLLGKCYYRTKLVDKAVETAQKVVDLYGASISQQDRAYAIALDNLAFYQSAVQQYEAGLDNCQKALSIYEKHLVNDYHLAAILSHLAELCSHNNRKIDAINYELRSLNIIKQLFGEHSEEYLTEAPYLQIYYEENGDSAQAEKLADNIERLTEETKKGIIDLPTSIELKNAETAHEHNNDVYRCIEYYLNHYVVAYQMNEVANYILNWSKVTADSHVVIGENETKLMEDKKSMPYFIAYIAGCSKYALEAEEADFTYDTFKFAMIQALNYYQANKQYTGEIKYLEKYIKAYHKSHEKFNTLLRTNFPGKLTDEMTAKIKNGETIKIEK
ncbi:MAG: tetratricopeptide repeat protein [Prevotella sp.]|nr:tetratricopeptide repeat protein [Prevotella sp.]